MSCYQIVRLFRFVDYAKWIRRRYGISKDRYHYYIGGDAYRKYREDGYVMKWGDYALEFD